MKRVVLGVGLVFAAACAASRPSSELEPRYVAVHNTLAAMGLAEVGPLHRGALAEGREARIALDLGAGCTTVVAIGSGNVRDLDIDVLDGDGKLVIASATNDAEAAVKVCPPSAGKLTLVVKMTRGAGDFTVATWSGGAPPSTITAITKPEQEGDGTCESPIPLVAGTLAGNTRKGTALASSANCGSADSKELVYRLELTKEQRVSIDVDATFDSVLYVRHDDCDDTTAELLCNDDATIGQGKAPTSAHGSHVDGVLPPGVYFVFVDGYQDQAGSFRLTTELSDVPTLADTCKRSLVLASLSARGNLPPSALDSVQGTCGAGKGPEIPFSLSIPAKARARIVMHSDEFHPALHLRKTCTDDSTEIACTDSGANAKPADAAVVATLDPGTYTLFADSSDADAHGKFEVDVELATPDGKGIRGDSCADAIPLATDDKVVTGDTFDAKDDFRGQCSANGAPDAMYRFELAGKSRVTARFESEEGGHTFVLSRSCTDRTTETACGAPLDEVLGPGVYFLAVDGTAKGPFGRYAFRVRARDVGAQDAACNAAPAIALGQTITGTTVGAGDRFSVSCGGRADQQGSGDRVYKLVIPVRQRIQVLLNTPNHDGAISLRRACQDPPRMKSVREVEAACNDDAGDPRHAKIDTTVDAGTYWVVVDGHQGKNEGAFTLTAAAGRP